MTKPESENFIETELKGLWNGWSPSSAEYSLWLQILKPLDYNLARQALNNWYIQAERPGRTPIIGRIKQVLAKAYQKDESKMANEPVLLYEIIKKMNYDKGRKNGMKFSIGRRRNLPTREVIEQSSEDARNAANTAYGEDHIVLQHWHKEYDKGD